jgi:hypothetical protein
MLVSMHKQADTSKLSHHELAILQRCPETARGYVYLV